MPTSHSPRSPRSCCPSVCVASCSPRHSQTDGQHDLGDRSEEHTSELQSQSNLVCRLLLENKNDRPSSAAGFADAPRAHSTGTGTLLRNALTLYSEHLPTFMRLALLVYAPVMFTTLLKVTL